MDRYLNSVISYETWIIYKRFFNAQDNILAILFFATLCSHSLSGLQIGGEGTGLCTEQRTHDRPLAIYRFDHSYVPAGMHNFDRLRCC